MLNLSRHIMQRKYSKTIKIIFLIAFCAAPFSFADKKPNILTISSTTSTNDSGFYDYIVPIYNKNSSLDVRIISVGTGQALEIAKRGDADMVIVHHKESEINFVKHHHGLKRHALMYNKFVVVGPLSNPANIKTNDSIFTILKKIKGCKCNFISRGDNSGTHKRELELWERINHTPDPKRNKWYKETGLGMGQTLNITTALLGYTISDSATWLNFNNKLGLEVFSGNDEMLKNIYTAIAVNPEKHPHINIKQAEAFIKWLHSEEGRNAIVSYKIRGTQAFYMND